MKIQIAVGLTLLWLSSATLMSVECSWMEVKIV